MRPCAQASITLIFGLKDRSVGYLESYSGHGALLILRPSFLEKLFIYFDVIWA